MNVFILKNALATISPKRAVPLFGFIIVSLVLADIAGLISKYYLGHRRVFGLIELFDLDSENNIPAYFSSVLIFINFLLLCFIAGCQKKLGRPHFLWLLLAFIFLFLSIDEGAQIHERVGWAVKSVLHTSGIFLHAWVIPYGIAILIFTMGYFRFLLGLPKPVKWMTILAGTVYVGGAIGFELLGSMYITLYGVRDVGYELLSVGEESLEMLGMLIFMYALMMYVETEIDSPSIRISSNASVTGS